MKFFNRRLRSQQQWQAYQALELIPASVKRDNGITVLSPIVNVVTQAIVALRPVAFYSWLQVEHLEKCWEMPLEQPEAAIAEPEIQTPPQTPPLLWIMDGNFDGIAPKTAPPRNPNLIPPQYWSLND